MTNKWRPDDWENPHRYRLTNDVTDASPLNIIKGLLEVAYEEGADAMLEALTAANQVGKCPLPCHLSSRVQKGG